jgi:hypothetical protein
MTAWFARLVSLALAATVPVLFAAQNSAPRETVLNHVSVIDMTGRPIQRDMAVLLRGDRIAAIERAAGFNVPGARVLDLTAKFLIPGLVDMHHHLDAGAAKPGPHLKQMLGWGFTTVFSTAHTNVDPREFAELRRASIDDAGLPRYFGVGRAHRWEFDRNDRLMAPLNRSAISRSRRDACRRTSTLLRPIRWRLLATNARQSEV